jgi:hypothetical protein
MGSEICYFEWLMDASRNDYTVAHVAAFYKNDGEEGISVSRDFKGDDGNRFSAWCESAMLAIEASGGTPEKAKAWLDGIGRANPEPEMTPTLWNNIVATIHWLERRGHLVSDEFNGCMWLARCHRDDTIVALRYDQPSAENICKMQSAIPRFQVSRRGTDDFERLVRDILHTAPSQ